MSNAPVGIVANPASGRDVRGLVARASVFPLAEKCSMISRLLTALASTGIRQVLIMPDRSGLAERVRRALTSPEAMGQWPEVKFLDMSIQDGPADTVHAVKLMVEYGVAAIVVLGGDGTHRLVSSVCGESRSWACWD
ncbi:MAG: NAD(+)/NADH kinase [Terriglobia bacterium]